jgi:UDP-glucose 4-epimerase
MEKKNILVTGGAGFVGTNLVIRLKELGHNVIVLDNLFFGKKDNYQSEVQYILDDTKNIFNLNLPKLDLIYHLGEYSKITPSFNEIKLVFDLNIKGSFEVVEYCRTNHIPLIYSASSTRLSTEGDGHSPYSFFKSLITQLIKNYSNWYGLKYNICYFYNVYGPYHDTCNTGWETVISIFEKQLKSNKPLTIAGDGTQRRDFTFVGDIVNGLILASNNFLNEEYQLGSGQDYSIKEVAEMFGGDVVYVEARPGDRKYGIANTNETFKKLGWKPQMNLAKWIENIKNGNL